MNIKETKEVVALGIALAHAVDKSLGDGKIALNDLVNVLDVVRAAPAAVKDISKVPAEIQDMDAAEREDLVAYIEQRFDIANDKAEAMVEMGLKAGLAIAEMVLKLKK